MDNATHGSALSEPRTQRADRWNVRRRLVSSLLAAGISLAVLLGAPLAAFLGGPAAALLGAPLAGLFGTPLAALLGGSTATAAPAYAQGDYFLIFTREIPGTGGAFSLMDMNTPWDHDNNYGIMHNDVWACFHEGLIYVVNRQDGDNIQVLDPQDDFNTVLQFSVGAGSNPQEICFVDGQRAFVTRYNDADLWEVDPSTGDHTDTIDLSPLADPDGLPEMQGMAIRDGLLYVTVQRFDRDNSWTPVPPSYLAVIDLADNTLLDMDAGTPGTQGIPLAATNPNSGIRVDPLTGDFLIGETGEYFVYDGGIERFDPVTKLSAGLIVTEVQLQGDLNIWKTADGQRAYAICLNTSYETRVVACDLGTGENLGTVISANEYAYADLHIDTPRDQLFIADRGYTDPGMRVIDTETHQPLTPGAIGVGLYPQFLLAMHGPNSGTPDRSGEPALTLEAFPSPAAGPLTLRFDLPVRQEIALEIFDSAGRRIATPARGGWSAGVHSIGWNGRDGFGRPAPAGTYFALLRTTAGGQSVKIQLIRPPAAR
ncbi:MAG: hypothetical protein KAY32_01810 [Candidatus Eisenbacteria sp.]|nr:hypothetical protein [Candidatus Eisenbacteria bacterium]